MEKEELLGIVWDTLAQTKKAMSVGVLSDMLGLKPYEVQSSLTRLRQANLVEVSLKSTPEYTACTRLDALKWAQAADLGVSLLSLERYAVLVDGSKTLALELATRGDVEKITGDFRKQKEEAKKAVIRQRAMSKVAATDLAQIVKDAEESLQEMKKEKGLSPEALKLLSSAHGAMAKALDGLQRSIEKNNGKA